MNPRFAEGSSKPSGTANLIRVRWGVRGGRGGWFGLWLCFALVALVLPRLPLLEKHLPRNSRLKHEQNARKSGAIVHARAPTLGSRRLFRQEWFDYGPKFVGYEWFRMAAGYLITWFC